MKRNRKNRKYNLQRLTEEMLKTADQLVTDTEAYEQAGAEDCEEQHFTLDGRLITDDTE